MVRRVVLLTALATTLACGRQAFLSAGTSGPTPTLTATPTPTPDPGTVPVANSTGQDTQTVFATTSASLSTLSVGAGNNLCLLATLSASRPVKAVQMVWNTAGSPQSMTLAISQTNAAGGSVWVTSLPSPVPGQKTLRASWTGTANAVLGATSFSGVAGNGCGVGAVFAVGTDGAPTVHASSGNSHLSFGAVTSVPAIVKSGVDLWASAVVTSTLQGAFVQEQGHEKQNTTADTVTLANPPLPGDDLIFVGGNPASPLKSVTGGGVTWAPVVVSSNQSDAEIWVGYNSSGGPGAESITYTCPLTGGDFGWVSEWSGLGAAMAASRNNAVSTTASPGSVNTIAGLPQLVVLGISSLNNQVPGNPSGGGWTSGIPEEVGDFCPGNGNGCAMTEAYQTVNVASAFDPTSNVADSQGGWDAAIAVFALRPFSVNSMGSAAQVLPGAGSVTHTWSTAGSGQWAAVSVEVIP